MRVPLAGLTNADLTRRDDTGRASAATAPPALDPYDARRLVELTTSLNAVERARDAAAAAAVLPFAS